MNVKEPSTLIAKNLSVGWEHTPVASLDELSVQTGQILALAGPNGVGKSTVIKTLARQIKPLSGTVFVDSIDCQSLAPRKFAQLVSYVPQMIEPVHEMSVEEFISLGRFPHQMWWSWETNNADKDAVASAMERTETVALRKKIVTDLSGGERQRVAVAMALAQQSRFMLLDEPTAHLDFKHQLQLLKLLDELRQSGLGIVIVLHDLNLIARLADNVILLKTAHAGPSRPAATGTPAEVLNFETLKIVYEVEVSISVDPITGATNYVPTASV